MYPYLNWAKPIFFKENQMWIGTMFPAHPDNKPLCLVDKANEGIIRYRLAEMGLSPNLLWNGLS